MKKTRFLFLSFILLFHLAVSSYGAADVSLNTIISDTAEYLYETVPDPKVGSIGGEWAVLGLARSGAEIPAAYYEKYYQNVEDYVQNCGGVLHDRKYTEYARVILALTAIGKNPADVAGYNLLMPLGDYQKTVWQGINGSVWALIALDSGAYEMPKNPGAEIQATREMYLNHILERQTSDGGWALSGDIADPDITAMALQALSKYQDREPVKQATERGLSSLSEMQNANGGFSSWNTENSESCAQVLTALCELNLSLENPRFVKNGKTVLDNLLSYSVPGKGFLHTLKGTGSSQMATEQCFYALIAAQRRAEGKTSLYNMEDAIKRTGQPTVGLAGKHPDVQKMELLFPGKTFTDIQGHPHQAEIEALASRKMISGISETCFEPDSTMTRAEFATIIVRGLGLPGKAVSAFADVVSSDWFYDDVNTAYSYGLIKGVSETEFHPNGTITREEAAVMVGRAAKLCGMDLDTDTFATRDILAGFTDYMSVSDWAQNALAFCYHHKILSDEVLEIKPKEAVKRAEIASMLYHMLASAKLL